MSKKNLRRLVTFSALALLLLLISCTGSTEEPVTPPPTTPEEVSPAPAATPETTPTPDTTDSTPPKPSTTPKTPRQKPGQEPGQLPGGQEQPSGQTITTSEPTSGPTTLPYDISGLVVNDAYDGRVNLWWEKSTASDFTRYDIYISEAEIADTNGLTPSTRITDINTCSYQATGLDEGTAYYFAVTAVAEGGEETHIATHSVTPQPMPRGTVDTDFVIDVYQPDKTWGGTTLFADNHIGIYSRIIEVNMLGEIVWEYHVPSSMERAGDVELTSDGTILFQADNGVYEINRSGEVVWSYLTDKVSHDVDRLPNGNTIYVFGMLDNINDAQVTEVNPEGEIVWQWYAKDHLYEEPYKSVSEGGWTHTNAVTRMENGNTLISTRNFGMVIEVDPQGEIVRTIGGGVLQGPESQMQRDNVGKDPHSPHDPEILPNGNILVVSQFIPMRAVEMDAATGEVVWEYTILEGNNYPVRDADRLPNGNTLITGSKRITEVSPSGEIVWQLALIPELVERRELAEAFYKSERIAP